MAEGLNQPARSRRYLSLLSNTDAPLCLRRTRCGLEPAMADDPRRERQGQVGAAGLRSVATFGDVDGDARQYEGDQLLGTIVLVWLHMVQGRMVRGGGGALAANPP
jgi:hypothetical protein